MVSIESIWNRARADLVGTTEHGEPDVFLWEHSARVAQCASKIADFPDVRSQNPDADAIVAAALYHDAGWMVRLRENEISRTDILLRPTPDNHRDLGAVLMEKSLSGVLSPDSMHRASTSIRTLNDREISLIEGKVVTEAENLEEFGTVSLWPVIRRGLLEGKGVKAVIETWRRRREYQFWTARLNDSFRFPHVREIAEARLAQFERMMGELEFQQQCLDVTVAPASSLAPAAMKVELDKR